MKTRRQKDQIKGHELRGVLPEKKLKKALLSQSYYNVKVLMLEMKSQSLLDCDSELKSGLVHDSFFFSPLWNCCSQMQESSVLVDLLLLILLKIISFLHMVSNTYKWNIHFFAGHVC